VWMITNTFIFLFFLCREHYHMIEREGGPNIRKKHEANFERWFHKHLYNCRLNAENVSKQLYHLACGPDQQVRSYRSCIVNGVRYQTKECAQTRTTQNCGVAVKGEHDTSTIEYYGELKRILELRYPGPNTVYLFECDWWNIGNSSGIQTDQGFTSVNTGRKWYESDPFILACQAVQVFYLDDPKLGGNWKVVQRMINRNIYDIPTVQEGDNEEDDQGIRDDAYQEDECVGGNVVHVEDANNEELIAIDGLYVQLDGLEFINDNMLNEDHGTDSVDEEELSSHDDTDSEHEQSFSSNTDDTNSDSDDDMC